MNSFFGALVARLRYLFFIPVLTLAALSLVAMASGVAAALRLFSPPEGGSAFPVSPADMAGVVPPFIQSAFLFFLAAALSSLFLGELPVPQWMAVRNLHQLKNKVLTFLSVILGLFFLGYAVNAQEPIAILYAGGGVALVLGAIFVLVRFGQPAGDDSFWREGTRCLVPEGGREGRPEARPEPRREPRPKAPEPEPVSGKDWLSQQKDQLRFEVESLNAAMASGKGDRPAGQVTVGQAPRRHPGDHGRNRGRRRGRGQGGGGGQGGGAPQGGGGEAPA